MFDKHLCHLIIKKKKLFTNFAQFSSRQAEIAVGGGSVPIITDEGVYRTAPAVNYTFSVI